MPFPPAEALSVDEIPRGPEWAYEPKWDGFRCVAFRDADEITLQSKAGKPLTRYFPEIAQAVASLRASRCVLDGEIVIPAGAATSFDDLLQRIHPAKSRVDKLARETPGIFVVFDLLVDESAALITDRPFSTRRAALEDFAKRHVPPEARVKLSPSTRDFAQAEEWFESRTALLDGVIAKRLDLAYASGERTGMQKIKKMRTADCVIGGFRYASGKPVVGSLLLGLYDDDGLLHHVGFTSAFDAAQKKALLEKVEPLRKPPGFTGRAPGGPSRWSTERSEQWEPLAPELVVEIEYDHFTEGRFRHGTKILRWRPDKAPRQCTMDQVVPKRVAGSSAFGLW
jgi:ATP-dependent DNA ligase